MAIDSELMDRLDQAAADLDRSRSWVARRAFEAFLSSRSSPGLPATAAGQALGKATK
ncbi:MAG: ribbon-helix-helix protein, CopG family [Acetobacteraceae bacterium]